MENRVTLVGYLGKDPEVRFTGKGTAVANFSIATSQRWKDQQGNAQEKTEWHQITVWGKLAEICGENLQKGRQVYLEGRLETQKYKDKQGNDRYQTKIVANHVRFLGGGGAGSKSLTDIEALTNKALAITLDEDGDLNEAVKALKGILALCQKNSKAETQGEEPNSLTEEQAELERQAQELGIFEDDSNIPA